MSTPVNRWPAVIAERTHPWARPAPPSRHCASQMPLLHHGPTRPQTRAAVLGAPPWPRHPRPRRVLQAPFSAATQIIAARTDNSARRGSSSSRRPSAARPGSPLTANRSLRHRASPGGCADHQAHQAVISRRSNSSPPAACLSRTHATSSISPGHHPTHAVHYTDSPSVRATSTLPPHHLCRLIQPMSPISAAHADPPHFTLNIPHHLDAATLHPSPHITLSGCHCSVGRSHCT